MKYRGRIFDGNDLIEMGEIGIDESSWKIEYVEEIRSKTSKSDDGNFKISDITFMPGLIDSHVHFFGTESSSLLDWVLTSTVLLTIKSVNDAKRLLESGFTTVRALGDKVSLDMSKAERMGMLIGPKIISAGYSIAETGGNDDPKILSLDQSVALSYSYYCDGPWECRKAVRKNLRNGAEVIKAYASRSFVGGGMIKEELTLEELSAITDEAHRAHLKAAAHAYGSQAIENAIDAEFDTIEHGLGLTEDLAETMAKRGIFYVPTLAAYMRERKDKIPYRDEMIKKHIESEVKIAFSTGVKISAGTDFLGTLEEPHGENYREILLLSNIIGTKNALRAATSIGAECLDLKNTGRILNGYNADIIAVKGNPVENINSIRPENVIFVMKNGRVYKNLL